MRNNEKRQSRIRQTRELIRKRRLSGLLNNTKWHEVFEWVASSRIQFDVKLLSENTLRHCDFIRELESSSILIDNTGDFIEFFEIESAIFDNNVAKYLDSLGISYIDNANQLIVPGYAA